MGIFLFLRLRGVVEYEGRRRTTTAYTTGVMGLMGIIGDDGRG